MAAALAGMFTTGFFWVLLQAKNRPTWFVAEALVLACASLTVGARGFRAQEMRDAAGPQLVGPRDQAGLH